MGGYAQQVDDINHGLTAREHGFTRALQGIAGIDQQRGVDFVYRRFLAHLFDDGGHARHAAFFAVSYAVAAYIGARHQVTMNVAGVDQGDLPAASCRGAVACERRAGCVQTACQ